MTPNAATENSAFDLKYSSQVMCRVVGTKGLSTSNPICQSFATRLSLITVVLATALLYTSAAVTDDQNTAESHSDKGLQLVQAGDLAGAESELRIAVALEPNNPEFLSNLGTVLAMGKNLEESTKVFKRALKLDPTNQWLWRNNIQRLDFEQVRDTLLTVAGKLDLTMGGQPFSLSASGSMGKGGGYGMPDLGNLKQVLME